MKFISDKFNFTLNAYSAYLKAVKSSYTNILKFDEYFTLVSKPESFCIIRHDVDRKPKNALKMSQLEYEMGIKASYYFRTKPHTFKFEIIKEIHNQGHEIGYHYESLADTNGDMEKALIDFERNINKLREIVPVKTISMHGSPLKPYDNGDLWRDSDNYKLLKSRFDIMGEVYLHIDYTDIAFITDTGRNWDSNKANLRDKIDSKIAASFKSAKGLLDFLNNKPNRKMVFQVHPERWSSNIFDWICQLAKDKAINLCKLIIRLIRNN